MSELTKEDEYGIISRTMMNIRSLRVFAREVDFEQLLEMQEKLNVVIDERREDAEREAAERAERERKRQELLQLIAGEGFSPEELLGITEDAPKTRKKTLPKAPPKYQFEENGGRPSLAVQGLGFCTLIPQMPQVQYQVRELTSHKLCGAPPSPLKKKIY